MDTSCSGTSELCWVRLTRWMEELMAARQALAHELRREAANAAIKGALEPTGTTGPPRQGGLTSRRLVVEVPPDHKHPRGPVSAARRSCETLGHDAVATRDPGLACLLRTMPALPAQSALPDVRTRNCRTQGFRRRRQPTTNNASAPRPVSAPRRADAKLSDARLSTPTTVGSTRFRIQEYCCTILIIATH